MFAVCFVLFPDGVANWIARHTHHVLLSTTAETMARHLLLRQLLIYRCSRGIVECKCRSAEALAEALIDFQCSGGRGSGASHGVGHGFGK